MGIHVHFTDKEMEAPWSRGHRTSKGRTKNANLGGHRCLHGIFHCRLPLTINLAWLHLHKTWEGPVRVTQGPRVVLKAMEGTEDSGDWVWIYGGGGRDSLVAPLSTGLG